MKTAWILMAAALSAFAQEGRHLNDAEIVGVVAAAHQGEIDAARMACAQSKDGRVRRFAKRMAKDFGAGLQQLIEVERAAGLARADTDITRDLARQAMDEARQLDGLSGNALDRAYLDAQIADHAALLKSLDDDLIPSAKDASVAALLRNLRPLVARHLDKARRLQAKVERKQD